MKDYRISESAKIRDFPAEYNDFTNMVTSNLVHHRDRLESVESLYKNLSHSKGGGDPYTATIEGTARQTTGVLTSVSWSKIQDLTKRQSTQYIGQVAQPFKPPSGWRFACFVIRSEPIAYAHTAYENKGSIYINLELIKPGAIDEIEIGWHLIKE